LPETKPQAPRNAAPQFLDGQCLIAMPGMSDPRFEKSVIFMCAHSAQGAMGLVVNHPMTNVSFELLLSQLNIDAGEEKVEAAPGSDIQICIGGPVESGRGFVLHSADYHSDDNTLSVDEDTSLTATIEILRAIAGGGGPERALLALGYSGWSAGQLEQEINRNGWLTCPADSELLFETPAEDKYAQALAKLGVDEAFLSSEAGRA